MRRSKHKKAQNLLKEILANPSQYYVIHYSCESFYEIKDGKTPRITSIAVRNFDTAQTDSFSIHKIAEKNKKKIAEINNIYDELEELMLAEYFQYLERHSAFKFLHWNMRDINFGFKAIEHRYEVLSGVIPYKLPDEQKVDISRLLIDKYGVRYIGHPRIEQLMNTNKIKPKNFMSGKEEALAFDNQDYITLHQSTLSKVDLFANILERAANNTLKNNAKWRDVYGVSVDSALEFLRSNWWGQLFMFLIATIVGLVIGKILSI